MDVIGRQEHPSAKICRRWKIKKIKGIHTCTASLISQDHVRLDLFVITHNIVHLVKTNPGIQIKTLIADILQRFGYIVHTKRHGKLNRKHLKLHLEVGKNHTVICLYG